MWMICLHPIFDKNQVTWECAAKGSKVRPQTFVCFHCPLVAAAAAKSSARGKNRLRLKDQLLGRAHLARHSINVEKSKLWARLRTREVTGRDASLPAPFVGHVWHTGRPLGSWGVAPNPTRGAASGLRKGHCPLTLFLSPGLSALPCFWDYAALSAFTPRSPSAEPSARSSPAVRMPA